MTTWEVQLKAEELRCQSSRKFDEMYTYFENIVFERTNICFCGKLLTGLHSQYCNKFKTSIRKRVINNWDKFIIEGDIK